MYIIGSPGALSRYFFAPRESLNMKIFSISDLHLSGLPPTKPMEVFGDHWAGHWAKIEANWQQLVQPSDWVLLPGDLSWAMQFDKALTDLNRVAALPGQKALIRGNHDYWWQTLGKMQRLSPPSLHFIHNNFIDLPGSWAICGSRGWTLPDDDFFNEEDRPIYEREIQRLSSSLSSAQKAGKKHLLLMLHYPPLYKEDQQNGFLEQINSFPVTACVYGHLHGKACSLGYEGLHEKATYHLVSCDALNFQLKLIAEIDDPN